MSTKISDSTGLDVGDWGNSYRSLGKTGMMVSSIGVGTFNFSNPTLEDEAFRIIEAALLAGINFFDTAGSYHKGESERILGRAIKKFAQRHEVIISTKAHFPVGAGPNDRGNSRLHLIRACELSLKRLGTDYIDLFQVHRPDFLVPQDETLGALTDLVRQGKVRYIGCSTHPAWKLMESLGVSDSKNFSKYVSEQPPYNLLDRRIENELIPLCRSYGIGLIPYAPLAQGVLSGRYDNATKYPLNSRAAMIGSIYAERVNEAGIAVGRKLSELALEYTMTPSQLALLWVKDQPGITAPLFGPRTKEQILEILPVLQWTLSAELSKECDRLVAPGSAVTNFHNASFWMKQVL